MTVNGNYIAGEWLESDETIENVNPSNTDDIIAVHARATVPQVQRAISAASEAAHDWQRVGIQYRADLLDRVAAAILRRKDELGYLLSREEGKTLPEGIGEVVRAAQVFRYFAGEAVRAVGEMLSSTRPGIGVEVTREPLGVVGLITPWNFPAAIPAWKIAPALAYGNCVVFKPAELVPGSAHALAEIIAAENAPPGVFNLVSGPGSSIGEALVESAVVDAVSFTGSRTVGDAIAVKAAAKLKKVQLEMGGKNPLVVLKDADMDTAINCAVQGAYYSTGQRCTASSRLIVERQIHDEFVDRLVAKLGTLKIGDALDETTDIGPLASAAQHNQVLDYVNIGLSEGAELACGAENDFDQNGYFTSNKLFINASNDMRICREEIFGPVAAVLKADDFDHALDLANDTEFGLSAGVCTRSLRDATRFKQEAQAGMVMVNLPTAGVDYHVPFGGRKGSSYGPREQGAYAREFYTQVKTAYTLA